MTPTPDCCHLSEQRSAAYQRAMNLRHVESVDHALQRDPLLHLAPGLCDKCWEATLAIRGVLARKITRKREM
jgi:hypothetical protein